MLNLTDREWNAFYLRDVFPKIRRGRRLKTADHVRGKTPYVSSTAISNGVGSYISNDKGVRKYSNCLTIANSGSIGKTFYHPYTFVASDHVTRLQNPAFSPYVYRFLIPLLSRLEDKYSFNREISDTRINKEVILLPVNEDGNPDWQFMEDCIREREEYLVQQYVDYVKQYDIDNIDRVAGLDEVEWKKFRVSDVFSLQTGKGKGLNHLTQDENGISYLGATNRSNGVLCFVKRVEELVQKGNCIVFIRNGEGSIGYSVYKAEEFIASSDLTLGYNPRLNRYNGVFITTIADTVRSKYNFNYKRSASRLEKEALQLPATTNGEPDWDYMETFVKARSAMQVRSYLDYLKRKGVVVI